MNKIVYFDVQNYEKEFLKKHNEGKYDYHLESNSLNNLASLKEEYKDAKVISVFTTSRVSNKVLEQFPKLELIALRSVGFNHIDIDYCNERGIVVENTPNYGNKSVAEFAIALLLDVCRKVTYSYTEYKEAHVKATALIGNELGGKTVGIVGLGAIGAEFAKLAHGFDMKIIGFDFSQKQELIENYNVKYTDFDTLLSKSDFISLHAPLTKENKHMFNENAFAKMKKTSIIINTARGELIDTQALFNALTRKEIAGAGLDVLESEEAISDPDYLADIGKLDECALKQTVLNNRLLQLPNVIITPHIAYNTHEAINRILKTTMSNINSFFDGVVNNNVN